MPAFTGASSQDWQQLCLATRPTPGQVLCPSHWLSEAKGGLALSPSHSHGEKSGDISIISHSSTELSTWQGEERNANSRLTSPGRSDRNVKLDEICKTRKFPTTLLLGKLRPIVLDMSKYHRLSITKVDLLGHVRCNLHICHFRCNLYICWYPAFILKCTWVYHGQGHLSEPEFSMHSTSSTINHCCSGQGPRLSSSSE